MEAPLIQPSQPRRNRLTAGRRAVVLLGASAGLLLAGAGTAAFAVSGGGYSPYQQGCQPGDSDYATPNGQTYPGCHNTALNVESGGTTNGDPNNNNTKYAQFGLNHNLGGIKGLWDRVSANTDGTNGAPASPKTGPESPGQAANARNGCGDNSKGAGFDANVDYYQYYCPIAASLGNPCEATSWGTSTLTGDVGTAVAYQPIVQNGLLIYLGMDDNSDNGEHDGVGPFSTSTQPWNNGAMNGSSDGGAIILVLDPMKAGQTPSQTHPEGLLNAGMGFCADGICIDGTTQQQTVYHGCNANKQVKCQKGTPQNANVYNYAPGGNPNYDPSVNNESANCNAGDAQSTSTQACGSGGMNAYRSSTPANENVEPGVQLYSDPDPQRSPAAPSPFWPTPAVYAGTCGVYAGSPATTGQIAGTKPMSVGGVPVTNQAGQIAVDPNPSAC